MPEVFVLHVQHDANQDATSRCHGNVLRIRRPGALISAERGKERASRFLRLVHAGRAHIIIPLPVVAEWWRGRSDVREKILGASQIVASIPAAKAAGVALGRLKDVHAKLTVDAGASTPE
jgi:hypothetical protein